MIESLLKNAMLFILLVALQVLFLNNIDFLGFINPYVYIWFILSMPVAMNRNSAIIIAFLLGLTIDVFSNTMGIHSFSCVLIAFLRNYWINALFLRNDFELIIPSIKSFGFANYIKYALGIIFLHHFCLFFLEALSFDNFWLILLRVLYNSIVTLLLILGFELIKTK